MPNYPDHTLFDKFISMVDPGPCWKKGFATFLGKIQTACRLVMELSLVGYQNIGQKSLAKMAKWAKMARARKNEQLVNRHKNDKM